MASVSLLEGNHLCSMIYASATQVVLDMKRPHKAMSFLQNQPFQPKPAKHWTYPPFILEKTQIWWRDHCMSKTNPRGITSYCVFLN